MKGFDFTFQFVQSPESYVCGIPTKEGSNPCESLYITHLLLVAVLQLVL